MAPIPARLWTSSLVAVGVLSIATSVPLAIAGPNQETWTTYLTPSDDFMKATRNLGSQDRQLLTAFGGDFECWQWLNARLGPNDRVATFEIRTYYFDRPTNLFYLDGLEADPLLRLNSPDSVRTFLTRQQVRYIMIPAWAGMHPATRLLPMMSMLGTPNGFQLLARWGDTSVYAVEK